ncbi:archaeosortase/exosortase family protein [Candidatus Woesearchaeota archaeon]|nr:archaeosortase/exosortase family protein [Candidatus Woesearchaeota archaeon]
MQKRSVMAALKEWWARPGVRSFSWRLVLFLCLGYGLVPVLVQYLAKQRNPAFTVNAIYPLAFSLILIGVFVLANRKRLQGIAYSWNWLQAVAFTGLSLLTLSLFVVIRYGQGQFGIVFPTYYLLFTGLLYTFGLFFLALAVFQLEFFQRFFRQLVLAFSVTLPYFSFSLMLNGAWMYFSNAIMQADALLFRVLGMTYSMEFKPGTDPLFTVGDFSARVGAPCSGVESLIMFTGLYLFIALLDWNKLDKRKLLLLYPLGLVGMFLMSIIRVFILMLIGDRVSPALALSLFHTNVGWVLFVAYFLVFMYFAYPWLRK